MECVAVSRQPRKLRLQPRRQYAGGNVVIGSSDERLAVLINQVEPGLVDNLAVRVSRGVAVGRERIDRDAGGPTDPQRPRGGNGDVAACRIRRRIRAGRAGAS